MTNSVMVLFSNFVKFSENLVSKLYRIQLGLVNEMRLYLYLVLKLVVYHTVTS